MPKYPIWPYDSNIWTLYKAKLDYADAMRIPYSAVSFYEKGSWIYCYA